MNTQQRKHTTSVKQQSPLPSSMFKMLIFTAITALLIGLIGTLIGNISFADTRTYYATFTDATGVVKGDRVRISGVEVGSVQGIEFEEADGGRQLAKLEFTIKEGIPLYRDALLTLRFENIVGQRYLSIEESPGGAEEMPVGETFPVTQTTPALNLTQLFNGFQPLLRALDPDQVNKISFELVRAFQGEAGSYERLITDTASLTNHLADRDRVIGELVTNLNTVLQTVGNRDTELTALIVQFRNLMTGLSKDRNTIAAALPDLADLMAGTTGILRDVRAPLKDDIVALKEIVDQVAKDRSVLDKNIKGLPRKLRFMVRSGSYGSYFNFYVCGLEVRIRMLGTDTYLGTPGLGTNERDTVCSDPDVPPEVN